MRPKKKKEILRESKKADKEKKADLQWKHLELANDSYAERQKRKKSGRVEPKKARKKG
jgi:hypothetical protein